MYALLPILMHISFGFTLLSIYSLDHLVPDTLAR